MRCRQCGKESKITYVCSYCGERYCLEHSDPHKHDCVALGARERVQQSEQTSAGTELPRQQESAKKKARLVVHFTFLEDKKKRETEQKHTRQKKPRPIFSVQETKKSTSGFEILRNETRSEVPRPGNVEPVTPSRNTEATLFLNLQTTSKRLFALSFIMVIGEEVLRLVSYVKNPSFLAYLEANEIVKMLYHTLTPYVSSLIVFVLVCAMLFATAKGASKTPSTSNTNSNFVKQTIPIVIFVAISVIYAISITNWILILAS